MQDHYMVPPLERFDLEHILLLIAQKKYFVLHAPRQTGKTTSMIALAQHLNVKGEYQALYINVESAQAARENIHDGIRAVLNEMSERLENNTGENLIKAVWPEILNVTGANSALNNILSRLARNSPKPVVLLIDEIDSLVGDTLISVWGM